MEEIPACTYSGALEANFFQNFFKKNIGNDAEGILLRSFALDSRLAFHFPCPVTLSVCRLDEKVQNT